MKTIFTRMILLVVLMNSMSVLGQTNVTKDTYYIKTLNLKTNYNNEITKLQEPITDKIAVEESKIIKDQKKIDQLKEDKKSILFNPKFLNQFFSSEITSFATGIKDQSVEKYFINANTDNKSLSIGRSIDFREFCFKKKDEMKLKKMSNILTIYTQSGLDKGFSNLYEKNTTTEEYDWSNNLGVGIRLTHFFNGYIFYKTNKKDKIKKVNERIIDDYIRDNIGTQTKTIRDIDNVITVNKTIANDISYIDATEDDDSDVTTKVKEYTKKKYYDTYKAIVDKQIEMVKKDKLYTFYIASWVGAEYYKPITDKIVASTTDKIQINNNRFRDWRFDVFGNILVNHSSGNSFKLKTTISKFNTNEFALKNDTALTLQNIDSINPNTVQLNSTTLAYLGEYKERDVTTLRTEATFLFLNNSIGISGGYEKYLDYNIKNWKLGIPISLKDKDNKPTVNFEIVWREISKTHVIGINAVYSFGKFLK